MNDKLRSAMLSCQDTVKKLLTKISQLEKDEQMPYKEKLIEIKKIKEELLKVGSEIDSIKKEITLQDYNVN